MTYYNYKTFAEEYNLKIVKEVINNDSLYNTPNHVWLKHNNSLIHVLESNFTHQPDLVIINNLYKNITSWDKLIEVIQYL